MQNNISVLRISVAVMLIIIFFSIIGIVYLFGNSWLNKTEYIYYQFSDKNKDLNISICDFGKYKIKEYEGSLIRDDLQEIIFNRVKDLKTFKQFILFYPQTRNDGKNIYYQYNNNNYLKDNDYSFSKKLKPNSIIA